MVAGIHQIQKNQGKETIFFHKEDSNWFVEIPGIPEERYLLTDGGAEFMEFYSRTVGKDYFERNQKLSLALYTDRIPDYSVVFFLLEPQTDAEVYTYGIIFDWDCTDVDLLDLLENSRYAKDLIFMLHVPQKLDLLYETPPAELYVL